jgi:Kef-type K+ transport system membrane component KefB
MDKRSQARRSEAAFIFVMIVAVLLGALIKNIRLGIILGIIIGGTIVFLGWLRSQK